MPTVQGFRGTLAERFDRKTIPEPNSGCLLWIGANRPPAGYGTIKDGPRLIPATHAALKIDRRPVPVGMQALHRCDNPYCVNVDHLFIGDQQNNVDDMRRKSRDNYGGIKNRKTCA
jgi:hypothetical protein